jgi:hypothetical protein
MSEKKIITISPSIFDPSNFTKKNRGKPPDGRIKMKQSDHIKKNRTTKGKLLKYIREKQEEQYKKMFEDAIAKQPDPILDDNPKKQQKLDFTPELEPKTELEASVNYLQSIVKDQEIKKRKEEEEKKQRNNQTMKYQPISDSSFFQSIIADHVDNTENKHSPTVMRESFDNIVNNIHPDNPYEKLKMPIPLTNPTYGCLKNGKLPTYRQYMKNNVLTQKGPIHNMHSHSHYVSQPQHIKSSYAPPIMPTKAPAPTIPIQLKIPPNSQIPAIKPVAPVSNIIHPPSTTVTNPIGSTPEEIKQNERLKNISEIKQLREILEKKQKEKNKSASSSMKRKTIKKRTYYLGKSKVHPKVSVLVSNKTIRNQVNKKAHDLKQTSMGDVKKYLMQKGFIKVGSTAPHDVLRRMYESAQMIGGEITNYNSDNLLYNYLNA